LSIPLFDLIDNRTQEDEERDEDDMNFYSFAENDDDSLGQ